MAESPYRKKDPGPPPRMLAQEFEMIRVGVLGGLVQRIMFRDHGPVLSEWSVSAVKEAAGLMDGIADVELLRELFMSLTHAAQSGDSEFNILEEVYKLNKNLPSDG